MKTDDMYNSYTDFLRDKKFLQWQLLPDEELNSHWETVIRQHPELEKEMEQAIAYLKKKGLHKNSLDEVERTILLEKIQKSISQKKKQQRRLFWYLSTTAAAIALLVIGLRFFSSPSGLDITAGEELIVGELLSNEDIQLITSGKAILFQNDVEVTLNEEGTAEITQADKEASKIQIDRDKHTTLIVPYGKRSTLTLADGSKVWLNSGSVLEFPAQFNGSSREIRLTSGEMYVEVARDEKKPFHVETGEFQVRVYGTKFNVSNYSGSPQSVVLVEGRVSLQSRGEQELFITPNEKATYIDGGLFNTEKVDVNQYISWKEGYLSFDKTPMTEVLQQIGRYYNLSFDYENDINLQKRACTGKIYLSDNLDNVMTTIGLLSSTRYTKEKNHIYITNEND